MKIMSDLNIPHGKASFPFFEFTLVIKLRKFDLENHWNTSISDNLRRLSRTLAIIWEIPIVNFIEIV